MHRLGADTLLVADQAPEALIHEQDARHHGGLAHAQRLDSGPQPAMHDEGVHLPGEHGMVRGAWYARCMVRGA